MKAISRYILKQILPPLGVAMAIGLMLLLSERLVRLLEITLGQTEAFSLVFEMLAYLIPHYIGLAVPGAFFIGLMFGFNRLSKDSEIDALLAGGIGLHQLVRPLIAVSLIFATLAFLVLGYFQPYTRYAYRILVGSIKNTNIYFLAEEGVFMHIGNRTFALDEVSREKQIFKHVFIFQDNDKQGRVTTTAQRGRLIDRGVYRLPVLRMSDGLQLRLASQDKETKKSPLRNADITMFEQIDSLLGKERGIILRPRGRGEGEMFIDELWRSIDNPPANSSRAEVIAGFNDRILRILLLPVLPFLAIPFALSQRRGHRSYRFGAAVILLIVFNEIISNGKRAVALGQLSPLVGQWVPLVLFTLFALFSFYRAAFTMAPPVMEPFWERLHEAVKAFFTGLTGKKGQQ